MLANACCHSSPWWLNGPVRQQAGSYGCVVSNTTTLTGLLLNQLSSIEPLDPLDSIEPVSSTNQAGSTRSVGAGLLANVCCHSPPRWLNGPVRQQAGSYGCVVSNIPTSIDLLLNPLHSIEPVS
ncbi:hypothetical protein LT42_10565 [Pseudomonas lutea]|uniref:Uncharacterized protein n=1 Tax=Pseudomonas lutea TaxID=243924 RepID=A0A9X0EIB2_9PSED|nr:hypothetical protein LT42_10565 [Pseudomonas lutea]